jgi:hypothetical protein
VLKKTAALVAALSVALPALAPAAGDEAKEKKGKRPALEVRATPRFAFSPADIMFTAELKGGDEVEELYCPEVEWEFGDGDRSVQEADCEPWTPETKLDRRFTVRHVFRFAGAYVVRVTLRKSGKNIMTQSMTMAVRAGLGDPSADPG